MTKEEIKNNSCPCCGLPTQISGKLENYKISDSPDKFSNCGEGVILYFSFFKFCIIVTFIGTIGISFFDSYISYNYYYELQKFCEILNKEYDNSRYYSFIPGKCKVYSSDYFINQHLYKSFFFKSV